MEIDRFYELARGLTAVTDDCLLRILEYLSVLENLERRHKNQPPNYDAQMQVLAAERAAASKIKSGLEGPILQLPSELRALILDKLFEAVFVPGEIVPHHDTKRIGSDNFLYNGYYTSIDRHQHELMDALRTLNPTLYKKYKRRYWTDNTFVSGHGWD